MEELQSHEGRPQEELALKVNLPVLVSAGRWIYEPG
jgi:hypothetical protein